MFKKKSGFFLPALWHDQMQRKQLEKLITHPVGTERLHSIQFGYDEASACVFLTLVVPTNSWYETKKAMKEIGISFPPIGLHDPSLPKDVATIDIDDSRVSGNTMKAVDLMLKEKWITNDTLVKVLTDFHHEYDQAVAATSTPPPAAGM